MLGRIRLACARTYAYLAHLPSPSAKTPTIYFEDIFSKAGTRRFYSPPTQYTDNRWAKKCIEDNIAYLKKEGLDPEEWITVYRVTKAADHKALKAGYVESDGARAGEKLGWFNTTEWSRSTHRSGALPGDPVRNKTMWVSTTRKTFLRGFGLCDTSFEVQRKFCFGCVDPRKADTCWFKEGEISILTGTPIRNLQNPIKL
jgi:hypothetical protein